jgi:aminopeptidase N
MAIAKDGFHRKRLKIEQNLDSLSYTIQMRVLPSQKRLVASNTMVFKQIKTADKIVFQLAARLQIDSVFLNGKQMNFNRKNDQVELYSSKRNIHNTFDTLLVFYNGSPIESKNPPWEPGFVWSKDSLGNPFIGLACESEGASIWLPCFDSWNREPLQVNFSIDVPEGLTAVANGKLMAAGNLGDGFHRFKWQTNYPINHYGITLNIGKYTHLSDRYFRTGKPQLQLNYYVLSYHAQQAAQHFEQVKPMMRCFEKFAGEYPFSNEGYKLVETPYWGMEHQTCVAYGNHFKNNEFGFDFIIIHESAHEWFANSITAQSRSDMWIHESFTTYMESMFVECMAGPERAKAYLNTQFPKIKNQYPILEKFGINRQYKDNDIYFKGAWVLHTLRNCIDNDTLWFNTLYDFHEQFKYQITTTEQVIEFFSKRCRQNLSPFFEAYLLHENLPVFEYDIIHQNGLNELHFRLKSSSKKLEMPFKIMLGKNRYESIIAGPEWQLTDLPYADENLFQLKPNQYLIEMKRTNRF